MAQIVSLDGDSWVFKDFVGEDWLWRNSHKPVTRDVRGWQRGRVPGSVQHDLWQAGVVPDPYVGRNSLLLEWAPQRTWVYKRTFEAPEAWRGQRVQLRFRGVDYAARFFLNGELLGSHRSMYTAAAFEIGDRLLYGPENLLAVVIDPAPDEQPQVGYTSRVRTHKSRMTYWWDFCPRMVHLGIWDSVMLEVTGGVRIEDVFVQPHLSTGLDRADVSISTALSTGTVARVEVETIIRFAGETLASHRSRHVLSPGTARLDTCLTVENPELWWPNGHGAQPLYEAEVKVIETGGVLSDARTVTFGIRKVELVPNETADGTARPYTFAVNGQKIYAKGWNWVPIDVMYGVERPQKLAHLIELAVRANVNLFRVWGGGLIEKEAVYDLCDRRGIMVWQEFIQSSSGIENTPSSDPEFVAMMAREAEQIIPLKRNHPSLVVWCGGNELQDASGRPLDDAGAPVLAALHGVVKRLDPGRCWLPTSPSGRVFGNSLENIAEDPLGLHDVHGPWEHQGLVNQYTLYNQGASLLHSEFGVEGFAHLRTLERILAPEERWPAGKSNPAWFHTSAWWLKDDTLAAAFGELPDLAASVRASQLLQHDGLRYAVEADRRRNYHNSGTLPWQFNEPYPNAACTSAVDYFGQPKPAYYAVARAYNACAISARFHAQVLDGATNFSAEVWLAQSKAQPLYGARLVMRLVDVCGKVYAQEQARLAAGPNGATRLATVDWLILNMREELFFLDLALADAHGALLATNRYLFSMTSSLEPMLEHGATMVSARMEQCQERWRIVLSNTGPRSAFGVWLEDARPLGSTGYVYFDDNYLFLLPGETREVTAAWSGIPACERQVRVSGWNCEELLIEENRPPN